jgi:general secretion pathway protein D
MLQLKDGENQVLAGLIKNDERSSGDKVPGFGSLPLLGRLFGSSEESNDRTEVVLSITPHLVRNLQRPAASLSEFSAGTETSFRRRPDTSARAPAVLPVRQPPVPSGQVGPATAPVAPPVRVEVTPVSQPPAAGQQR